MNTNGDHFIIDAYACDEEILDSAEILEDLLTQAVSDLGMEKLSTYFHTFSPQGITGVIVLSTSHISIHTWPEHGYAAIDLYTCGNREIWPVLKKLLIKIKAAKAFVYDLSRGNEILNSSAWKEVMFSDDPIQEKICKETIKIREDQGNRYDLVQLKEIARGGHPILYNDSSQYQNILLTEAIDLRLYLNQELQFSSLDERYYHEALVFPAMENAKKHERVLILGGGDGLALREVLKYPDVKKVDLVDIDTKIIELAKTNHKLLNLNNGSFHDERVSVHIDDAKKFVTRDIQPYDVIIIDFPDPVDQTISSLYTTEMFQHITKLLAKEGVLVCQSTSPEDTPTVFWSIGKIIESAGLNTREYVCIISSFGLWGFHMASRDDLKTVTTTISVPHRALENDVSQLFEIPKPLLTKKNNAVLNSEQSLVLHELYLTEIAKIY